MSFTEAAIVLLAWIVIIGSPFAALYFIRRRK